MHSIIFEIKSLNLFYVSKDHKRLNESKNFRIFDEFHHSAETE